MSPRFHVFQSSQRGFSLPIAAAVLVVLVLGTSVTAAHADDLAPLGSDAGATRRVFLPFMRGTSSITSNTGTKYDLIPVQVPPGDCPTDSRPAELHGDKNLALRGYSWTSTNPGFVNYDGDTDEKAPQLHGIFQDARTPEFINSYRVNDWNWSCGPDGCRGAPLADPPVTLLGMGTREGELLRAPSRVDAIYPGGYTVLVIYAEESRLTLKYTREDTVSCGYTVHIENLAVDVNLLAIYRLANTAGRGNLPALRNGQPLGAASGGEVRVAIRDRGTFMDPRSRKDWWAGR